MRTMICALTLLCGVGSAYADPVCVTEARAYADNAVDATFGPLATCVGNEQLRLSAAANNGGFVPVLPPPVTGPGQNPNWMPVPQELYDALLARGLLVVATDGNMSFDAQALIDAQIGVIAPENWTLPTDIQVQQIEPVPQPDFSVPDGFGGDFGGFGGM